MNTHTTAAPVSRTKKVLIPLATLLAAGAIAVGSGATFTSSTNNTISAVTSGTLTQDNSKNKTAIFDLDNMKPGDVVNGSLTITNTGSLPAKFSLTEVSSTNGFDAEYLTLVITNTTTGKTVYKGTFGGLTDGEKTSLGEYAAKEANDYTFTVALDVDAPNNQQGKTASAEFAWDAVQFDGETTNQ